MLQSNEFFKKKPCDVNSMLQRTCPMHSYATGWLFIKSVFEIV